MESLAVGFDDQPLLSPKEVNDETTNAHVDLGFGQAMTTTQLEEAQLQLAAGPFGELPVVADREARDLGGTNRLAMFGRAHDAAQVGEGASRDSDRDGVANGGYVLGQRG
jgi:hypothetical protein